MVRKLDADFGVAVKGLAGLAAKLAVEQGEAVAGNQMMTVGGSGHGMDSTAKVFVLYHTDFLACKVVGDGDEIRLSQRGHGWALAGVPGAGKTHESQTP